MQTSFSKQTNRRPGHRESLSNENSSESRPEARYCRTKAENWMRGPDQRGAADKPDPFEQKRWDPAAAAKNRMLPPFAGTRGCREHMMLSAPQVLPVERCGRIGGIERARRAVEVRRIRSSVACKAVSRHTVDVPGSSDRYGTEKGTTMACGGIGEDQLVTAGGIRSYRRTASCRLRVSALLVTDTEKTERRTAGWISGNVSDTDGETRGPKMVEAGWEVCLRGSGKGGRTLPGNSLATPGVPGRCVRNRSTPECSDSKLNVRGSDVSEPRVGLGELIAEHSTACTEGSVKTRPAKGICGKNHLGFF